MAFRNTLLSHRLKKNLKKETPRWLVLVIDLYITINTFLLTFGLLKILGIIHNLRFYEVMVNHVAPVVFFALVAFLMTSSFKGIVRHTGFKDVMSVFKTMVLYVVLLTLFNVLVGYFDPDSPFKISKVQILVHFLVNTIAMIFLRILYKSLYYYYVLGNRYSRRVMIYGAGDSGVITYKALKNDEKSRVSVFGFIDDKKNKIGKKIDGIRVYDSHSVDLEFITKNHITEIIISIQNIKPKRLREIVEKYTDTPVSLKIVPAVSTWLKGDLTHNQIKNVKIEDLLGRKPIELNNPEVLTALKGKVILVTGAAGSIGSEISTQLMRYPVAQLIMVDQGESSLYDLQQMTTDLCQGTCEFVVADVRNKDRMEAIIRKYRPDMIFHAAAYKHVPLMEHFPHEAVITNVMGTKIVADLAAEYRVEKFVLVSTDKAVNPTNVMGATKRIAELYVTQLNDKVQTNFIVTRFGNVLGSSGSVIPIFKRQIENGGPITVTHPEITRYFMTIPEACQLVLEAGVMGKGGEVFVFDMGESVKIFDLAKNIIRLSGLKYPDDIDIKIIGLRPGEKIYEELLADGESTIKTHHPKIMIAQVKRAEENFLNQLQTLLEVDPNQFPESNYTLIKIIRQIVPEYDPKNTIYDLKELLK